MDGLTSFILRIQDALNPYLRISGLKNGAVQFRWQSCAIGFTHGSQRHHGIARQQLAVVLNTLFDPGRFYAADVDNFYFHN